MKPRTTISDLSQIRQLELYLELGQLGVLMTDVSELFPVEIVRAAEPLSGWPSLEELGISQAAIAWHDRAIKEMVDAQETGALKMDPLLMWVVEDEIRYARQNIGAERLRIVSEELGQIKKELREDKHNTKLLEEGKYLHLVKKFITRHFEIYVGDGSVITSDTVKKKPVLEKVEFPHPSKWSELTLTFVKLETIQVKLAGKQPVSRTFVEMGFENKKNGKPNLQWTMLQGLAKENGELYSVHNLLKSANAKMNAEQRIKRIRHLLRKNFQLKADPIPWIKADKCYRCSFTLQMDDYAREHLKELIPS